MWIKMLTDQVGPDGIFLKGQTLPLPTKTVAKLDSDSYVEVEMSEDRMEQMGIEDRLRSLRAESATLDAAVKSGRDRLADLYQRRKFIRAKVKLAENELEGITSVPDTESQPETQQYTESQTETQQDSKDESDNQKELSRPPGNVHGRPKPGPASKTR